MKESKQYHHDLVGKMLEIGIDADMAEDLASYVTWGQPVGDFLYQVLSNNLVGAYTRADNRNYNKLREYATILYNDLPASCWGSEEKVEKWMKEGGL